MNRFLSRYDVSCLLTNCYICPHNWLALYVWDIVRKFVIVLYYEYSPSQHGRALPITARYPLSRPRRRGIKCLSFQNFPTQYWYDVYVKVLSSRIIPGLICNVICNCRLFWMKSTFHFKWQQIIFLPSGDMNESGRITLTECFTIWWWNTWKSAW